MVVEGWLGRAASARPAQAALETPAGSWSYAELLDAARAGAQELSARGARRGQRVAIALPPGLAFAQALHSMPSVGRRRGARRPALLGGRTGAPHRAMRRSCSTRPWGRFPASAGGTSAGARIEHDLDATAVVIHTSGTTSSPRPVELTYGNFLWSALGSAVALGLDPQERWLCAMPLAHVGGLSILMRSAIYATTAVVHEGFDTERVLDALLEREITLVSLVATTLARLLDAGLADPPALRGALTGGGPVPRALVERARAAGVPVLSTYGLTEACSQVTTTPAAADEEGRARGGRALFCTRVRLARDNEIMVHGPTVAPRELASDGWLHTGDLGALDDDGRLLVTGRKADTIVSGGENVAPAEVEAVLEAHPDVLEAAVLGRPDPQWGEAVTAIVLPRPGVVIEVEALRSHCARVLAPYKVPRQVVLAREPLARTPSGKLRRSELR